MGRNGTGIDYTTSAPRVELSKLLKAGFFKRNAEVKAVWGWDNGDRAEITTKRNGYAVYMDITTHYTDYTNKPAQGHQRIHLHTKPSNLGRGEVLYFICPRNGRSCRILYRAYSSPTWRSRTGFIYRLYYRQQAEPAWGRNTYREHGIERELHRLYSMRATSTYLGKPTRRALRIARLEDEAERLALLTWHPSCLPPILARAVLQGFDPEQEMGWKRKA